MDGQKSLCRASRTRSASLCRSHSIPGPAKQLKTIQTSLDIAVFLEPILSSADAVQRTLAFVA